MFLFSRGSNNSGDVNLAKSIVYSLQSDVMFTFEFFHETTIN